jgi:lactoylglutathione lyase
MGNGARTTCKGKKLRDDSERGNIRQSAIEALSNRKEQSMELGAFSISLTVKDIEASRSFYEKFGFKVFAGNAAQNWLILKNGDRVIGLFQGMFEKNILTFNPGWDQNAQKLPSFTDVRELQRQLKAQGVQLLQEADESTTGPASFIAVDPDGNPILVDQHV